MLADLEKLLPVFKGGRYVKEGRFITGSDRHAVPQDGATRSVVGPVHWSAGEGRPTVAVDPYDINIGTSLRDAANQVRGCPTAAIRRTAVLGEAPKRVARYA
jgi:hypothetical protein